MLNSRKRLFYHQKSFNDCEKKHRNSFERLISNNDDVQAARLTRAIEIVELNDCCMKRFQPWRCGKRKKWNEQVKSGDCRKVMNEIALLIVRK